MLKNFPVGSDLTLMNTIYKYPSKQDNGKWDKGAITLVYKDNLTGEKYNETFEDPDYEYYMAKENITIENNELFRGEEDLEKISVPYTNLEKDIAERTGNLNFYYDNIKSGNRSANKKLHTHARVFNSDINIEDHYRFRFSKAYTNEQIPISKSFFDIEADTINMKGDFPEMGECPINAVSLINELDKRIYIFLLRNPRNPLIQEFENEVNSGTVHGELNNFIREAIGGWKQEVRFGLDKFDYKFMFYDEEIQLIQELFMVINWFKPDFVLAWNMGFDIPYIIERLKVIGYNPGDIMCHPDFKYKQCRYVIDERNKDIFAERGDFSEISSYSVFTDQMIHFASRRKGQSAFQSFKLDYIGQVMTKVRKLDYSHITTKLAELPYKDYKTFVFYNIMDTIVQYCIEKKTGDIDYIFSKCLINNTRYSKGHRQTIYLPNRACKEFYKDGFVLGNNANKFNEKPLTKFPGAFVADPIKLNDTPKVKINGYAINIVDNADDYDYRSLYPSEMREFNIAPHTQIGKIEIDSRIYENENPFKDDKFNRGSAFAEDLQSQNYMEFCRRWLNLGSFMDVYKDTIEYYTNVNTPVFALNNFNADGKIIGYRKLEKGGLRKPIAKREKDYLRRIDRYHAKPDDIYELTKNIDINKVVYYG